MNLLALNAEGYRSNGSIGFAINDFDTVITCEPWPENLVMPSVSFCKMEEAAQLTLFLNDVSEAIRGAISVKVCIEERPGRHAGFGSGTSLRLMLVDALLQVNGLELSRSERVRLSRRGGTSGVGINTYFYGGFVAESGVANNGLRPTPSADKERESFKLPTVIVQQKMPAWFVGIFLADSLACVSGAQESKFFSDNTPISQSSVESSVYHAIMGATAAVIDADYQMFAKSVKNIQKLKWKSAEWDIQGASVHEAARILYRAGATSVGLSSFGPALYYTGKPIKSDALDELGRSVISSPNNVGRVICRV